MSVCIHSPAAGAVVMVPIAGAGLAPMLAVFMVAVVPCLVV
jgi:hypothetical protein